MLFIITPSYTKNNKKTTTQIEDQKWFSIVVKFKGIALKTEKDTVIHLQVTAAVTLG